MNKAGMTRKNANTATGKQTTPTNTAQLRSTTTLNPKLSAKHAGVRTDTTPVTRNTANATIPPRAGTAPLSDSGGHFPVAGKNGKAGTFFKLALLSLLLSLAGLSYIFGFQVEMKGAGAYLYLFVVLFAFLYIVSTMIYVFLSTQRR